jgi:hypothetical protein
VYLDDQKRPHKLIVDGQLFTTAGAEGKSVAYQIDATMTFADFGKPVEVAEPPAAQVSDQFSVEVG